jgi:phage virion morphogenesis protein
MTGVVIQARFIADEARVAITHLMRAGTDPRALLAPIGTGMVRATHDRFRSATDPQGAAWQPLNDEYAAGKKRGAGILRGAAMSGGLMGSITRDVQGYEVAVGTSKVHGAIHQFGGVIYPKRAEKLVFRMNGRLVMARSVTIPARPFPRLGSGGG